MSKPFAIIVGAGPSGFILSLLLARAGLEVQLLDEADKPDDRPRATHYGPVAMAELERAGVVPDILAKGFMPNGITWRKLDGTVLIHLPTSMIKDQSNHQVVCLPLDQLGEILSDHLRRQPNARVSWKHKVVGVGQRDGEAWVDVETPDGKQRQYAFYVIGCDGANSQVRRSLFGDEDFPGWTWNKQIIATNVSAYIL